MLEDDDSIRVKPGANDPKCMHGVAFGDLVNELIGGMQM